MQFKHFLLLFALLSMGYYFFQHDPMVVDARNTVGELLEGDKVRYKSLVLTSRPPVQVDATKTAWKYKDFNIQPLAAYGVRARVLDIERYYLGDQAELAPYDLAIGWGAMSNQDIVDKVSVSQGMRNYYLDYDNPGLRAMKIHTLSANIHIIPATPEIEYTLSQIIRGDIVRMTGYLVSVTGKGDFKWRSSMTRGDIGKDASELIWLDNLDIVTEDYSNFILEKK